MNFDGYVERIAFHFERLGVEERPSQREYVEAWNNQVPAKRMAQTFARRAGRRVMEPNCCHDRAGSDW